jgi:hypothetical protein
VTSQISAPVRIVALIGMLAALAMGGWVFTAGMRGGGTAAGPGPAVPLPAAAIAQANAVAGKLNAHNLNTAAGKPTVKAAPKKVVVAKKVVAPKTTVKHATSPKVTHTATRVARRAATLPEGTPTTIAGLLGTHRVVVVLLYNPTAKVDSYSVAEAALGATQANAGFLRVNVLDQRRAAPFTTAYGVLQDPTLLFFVRPGKLIQTLVGFADHQTIAQAAVNAALGIGTAS